MSVGCDGSSSEHCLRLFIGGPWHGKRKAIRGNPRNIEVPLKTEVRLEGHYESTHEKFTYRYQAWRKNLMIGEDVSFDDAIDTLIHGFLGGAWRDPVEEDHGQFCYLRQFHEPKTPGFSSLRKIPMLVELRCGKWVYRDSRYGTWNEVTDKVSRMECPQTD